ncbi:hypothetical protein [Flavobacterium branchiicola]|uniref:Uncharacterized protein n=1 Tax=Flavobacterium branchiicola TaxID=1114875 RepID=A0ABV9PI34_9FLAO|nr:hypothetical protein [Flavobacterium branchiicola]MBS7256475.1 hypothetical protein [Flavobacterium branchiicola]
MKKKLEADLISIAHRILKLKNKSDINQLYAETQKLYEKLAVLKFVEENFEAIKPTIGQTEINAELETIFNKEEEIAPVVTEIESPIAEEVVAEEIIAEETIAEETIATEETNEPEISEETPEEITEPVVEEKEEPIAEQTIAPIVTETIEPEAEKEVEKIEESLHNIGELSFTTVNHANPIPDFKPAFELEKEAEITDEIKEETKIETSSKPTILFEDFGINYADAQFVKVDSFEAVSPVSTPSINEFTEKRNIETAILETPAAPKTATLNEKLAKGFHIDLNDRIAFTKNLFGNSTEDYSRVLNQLLTFDTYNEAQDFIENMVKPDYNNWEGKDDYAERFLGIIEKKFS